MIKNVLQAGVKKFHRGDAIALFAGFIVPLAFAPFQYAFLTITAAALLFYLWLNASAQRACWQGWLFGLGYFGVGISWLYVSIHLYGGASAIVALLFTLLFISSLALFFALMGYCFKRYFYHPSLISAIAFASLWVLLEYCRSHLFTGFPWLLVGDAQLHSPLKGFLPVVGVYGTTFITIFCAALLVSIVQQKNQRFISCALFLWIMLCGFILSQHAWTTPDGKHLNVSLIQGNINQTDKWQPQFFNAILQTYHQLSMKNLDRDLIVWPETAIPVPANKLDRYLEQLNKIAKQSNTTILMGVPVTAEDTDHYYNALLTVGQGNGHYYKKHLVPFGEYIPFGAWMRPLLNILNIPEGDYRSGGKKQAPLVVNNVLIAAYICYDIAYNQWVYRTAKNAHLLVTVSDDSWFGHSFAASQHLQIAQVRAAETGRPMLFATNNGISAIIDPKGHIVKKIAPFTSQSLRANVPTFTGITPIASYGNLPILLIMVLLLGVSLIKKHRSFKIPVTIQHISVSAIFWQS
jgi:apolipoprotein N-acyltransferase